MAAMLGIRLLRRCDREDEAGELRFAVLDLHRYGNGTVPDLYDRFLGSWPRWLPMTPQPPHFATTLVVWSSTGYMSGGRLESASRLPSHSCDAYRLRKPCNERH